MTRPVHWTRATLDDFKEQVSFIAKDDRAAALRIADRIRDTATALGQRAIGRPGRVTGTYEKSVTGLPFIIAYALVGGGGREGVVILRVIHIARNLSPESCPEWGIVDPKGRTRGAIPAQGYGADRAPIITCRNPPPFRCHIRKSCTPQRNHNTPIERDGPIEIAAIVR